MIVSLLYEVTWNAADTDPAHVDPAPPGPAHDLVTPALWVPTVLIAVIAS